MISLFVYEENKFQVTKFQRIFLVDEKEVSFFYPHYLLRIKGKNLSLSFYEKEEAHVEGKIEQILLEKTDEKE